MLHAVLAYPATGHRVRGAGVAASEVESRGIAKRLALHWARGWGPYMLTLEGAPVGYAGLRLGRIEGRSGCEALWGIVPAQRRRGHASRAMRAVLGEPLPHGFGCVECWTLPENRPSRATMETLGFRHHRNAIYADREHVVYRREAAACSAA